MELKTIHIEVGNDALLRFLPKYQDGEAVCPEAIDNLVVETGFNGSMTEVPHTIQDGRICFPISADQAIGTYDIRLTGTIAGQHKRTTYQRVYARCANSSGIHGRTITYDYDLLLVGSSSAELDAAVAAAEAERAHLATATAAADAARTEYIHKADALGAVAQETTSQAILTAIGKIKIDPEVLAQLADKQDVQAILEAIKQGGGGGSLPAEAAEQIAYTAEQLGYDGTPTEWEVISPEEVDDMINEAWSTTFGKADPTDPTSKDFQYICDMADALLYGDIQQSAQDAVEELMERLNP